MLSHYALAYGRRLCLDRIVNLSLCDVLAPLPKRLLHLYYGAIL